MTGLSAFAPKTQANFCHLHRLNTGTHFLSAYTWRPAGAGHVLDKFQKYHCLAPCFGYTYKIIADNKINNTPIMVFFFFFYILSSNMMDQSCGQMEIISLSLTHDFEKFPLSVYYLWHVLNATDFRVDD